MFERVDSPSKKTERIVRRFAAEAAAGRRPSIEAALDAAPPADWGLLLHTMLVTEVKARKARGETPQLYEYLPRFPAHTDVVRAVLAGDATVTLHSQQTLTEFPVAPLPIPLTAPVTGPLPQAIVLTGRESARPSAGRRRSRRWAVAGVAAAGVAVMAYLVLSPRPARDGAERASRPPAGSAATPSANGVVRPRVPAPSTDPERNLAEWVTALGGRGTLQLSTGGRRTFGDEYPLPRGKFVVTGLTLPPEAAMQWSESDLERLRGRPGLADVRLFHPSALTDAALEPLKRLPLTVLELAGTVRVSGATLGDFPDIESLSVLSAPDFADADLAHVAKLAKLQSLTIDTPRLTPAGLSRLKNPALRSLAFGEQVALRSEHIRMLAGWPLEEFDSDFGMNDDAFLEFAVFPNLKRIRLRRTSLTDAGLKAVLGLGKLEEFRVVGSEITGSGLEHFEDRSELRVLDLSGSNVQDQATEFLAVLPALREVRLAGCPITDQGATVLSQIDGIQTLDLGSTEITDASLRLMRKHPTLKNLVLTNTRTTIDWVREFERTTPNCRVVWSPRRGN